MESTVWPTIVAAALTSIVALGGVWWSIAATNRREQRRWRDNKLTDAVASLLARSQETTEAVNRYVEAHHKVVRHLDRGGELVTDGLADRFEVMHRFATLRSALSLVWLVATPEVNREAAMVLEAHGSVLSMMRANDSAYAQDFEGWKAPDGSPKPRDVIKSSVDGIARIQGGVAIAEQDFTARVRAELGLPRSGPPDPAAPRGGRDSLQSGLGARLEP